MKNLRKFLLMALLLLAASAFTKVKAQDVVATNPNNTKVLCDTAGVRMILCWWKPGDEFALHTHPIHQVYCIEGGQLTIMHQGGKTEVRNLKSGDHMQGPPEMAHTAKNTGKTNVKMILVEITK